MRCCTDNFIFILHLIFKNYSLQVFSIQDLLTLLNCIGPALCLLENDQGFNYMGTINVTSSGKKCQRWDAQTPHSHGAAWQNIPERNLTLAENYCRNTFIEPGPYCLTMDPLQNLEGCVIPKCGKWLYL